MAKLINPSDLFYRQFEPKLQNRFIFYVNGIPSYILKKASRPKENTAVVDIDHINLRRFSKGKSVWQPISVEFYDPIIPSGAQAVMNWFRRSHESTTGRDGYATFYMQDVTIEVIGPPGDVIEEWILKNAWLGNAIDFQELDWAQENALLNISAEIVYNYAILNF